MIALVAQVGTRTLDALEGAGRFTRFCLSVTYWLVAGAGRWGRVPLLMPQLYQIGTKSVPVVMLVGAFIGMVLGVEAYGQFAAIGQEARLGSVINISVLKQIGPVLAAVMLAGRVGSAISAELGTMKVTEQLDALRVMGADPVAHLVVPRLIACVVMIPALTVFSDLTGVWGGYLLTVEIKGTNAAAYWENAAQYISTFTILSGLGKSVVFGLMIGLIACYKGFHCKAGAEGVGRAATETFVASFIAIIIANLFLAQLVNDLHRLLFGRSESILG